MMTSYRKCCGCGRRNRDFPVGMGTKNFCAACRSQMTRIRNILDWGQWATVLMACGHKRRIRKADVAQEQLFIGKTVPCADCRDENTKGRETA